MSGVLSADSLGKGFGTKTVLRSASLNIGSGVTVLVGRNGAGKTTLVSILVGLLEADAGLVRFHGRYLERPRWAWMARRGLAYLPAGGFIPTRTRVSTFLRGVSQAGEDYWAILEQGGLGELHNRKGSELSTGERRLAELAWLALRRPSAVIADEPLRTLSPIWRGRAMALMRELADGGSAVLITGHEPRELLAAADNVQWLHDGYIRDLGSTSSAQADPAFLANYLGRDSDRPAE